MLFNSFEFLLLFLPLALGGYYLVRERVSPSAAHAFLVVSSLVFYGYWDLTMLPVLLASLATNSLIGARLVRAPSRPWLTTGIVFNLALIGVYKYADFALENLRALGAPLEPQGLTLPLGISFFTFQAITYLVDAHRGLVAGHSPVRYAAYITFFPQLIAGPIVQQRDLIPQLEGTPRRPDAATVARGLTLFIAGLFKKVVIADNLAPWADGVFANAPAATFFEAWTGVLAYTLELYFDFCGYSEMAMGLGLLFGIRLPLNFNSPYRAASIQDFWRRWHITLGRFLRDYLYVPLGGSHHGRARLVMALMVTMLLGGLWHGAGWQFIAWGALHGVLLVVCALWQETPWRLPAVLARTTTFLAVVFAWVLFRAASLSDAAELWAAMAGLKGIVLPTAFAHLLGEAGGLVSYAHSAIMTGAEIFPIALLLIVVHAVPNIHELMERLRPTWCAATAIGAAGSAAVFGLSSPTTFLYFQF